MNCERLARVPDVIITNEHGRMKRGLAVAGFVFVYFYAFPYFGLLKSANELPRVLMTEELVEHQTARIDRRLRELGSWFDVAVTPTHRHYSNKAPGPSFLAVPAYIVCKGLGATSLKVCTWAFRISVSTIPTLLFLPFFFRVTRYFTEDPHARRTALVAVALGSIVFPYALLFMSHALAAVCAGGAFVAAVALCRGPTRRPDLAAVGCGLLAGSALLMDYQAVLASLAVGIYLVARAPRRLRHAVLATAGSIPPIAILAFYHWTCFGSPWRTGYAYAADPANHRGVMGIIGPNREALMNALISPSNGLFVLMPWVLLTIVGGVAIACDREWRKRVGAEAMVCGAVLVGYVLFLGSLVPEFGRAGWSVGPRYITVVMPFAAWLASAGFAVAERRAPTRMLAQALVLMGVIIYVLAASTYPHWPDYVKSPLDELSLRMLQTGRVVHSLGTALGLSGIAAIAPLYVVAAVLALSLLAGSRVRARLVTTWISCVLAAWTIASYRKFPHDRANAERALRFIDRTWEPAAIVRGGEHSSAGLHRREILKARPMGTLP
jgi:hypothetical protein